MNLKFVEIPIRYKSRTYGTSNISPVSDGWLLFKICWFAMMRFKFG
jgi:hypothetical protein